MSFGRLERRTGDAPMSEINVTPLVDVMLVLLVIFMLAAPLMTSALRLELPRAAAAAASEPPQSVRLEIEASGQALLEGRALDGAQLGQRLQALAAARPEAELQLRADRAVPYGRVVEVIGLAQAAGLARIAFVAEPAQPAAAPTAVPTR